ncbi:V4R domain-containing protein [Methanomethylovorans sp.]|uniref:V4R domain-containing protein n=1 Tax=Methanomethylovorans sp. TaxID=2758717 RepID=UPI00345F132B
MVRDLYMFFKGDEKAHVVWFSIIYKTDMRAEANINSALNEMEVKIRFAYLDNAEPNGQGKYVLFTEVREEAQIDMINKRLLGIDGIIDIESGISRSHMIHSVDFPLNFLGERALITRSRTFVDILKIIREKVIQPDALLLFSGLKGGRGAAKYVRNIIQVDMKNCLAVLRELFLASGWGKLEMDFNKETCTGKVVVRESFIADAYGPSDLPVCGYMSGFIAGYMTEVMGYTFQVREISCKSMGNAVCEHVISPAPEGAKPEHIMKEEIQ